MLLELGRVPKEKEAGVAGEGERDTEREREKRGSRHLEAWVQIGVWLPLHSLDSGKRKVQVRVKGWASGFYFLMGGTTKPRCGGARSMLGNN